MYSWGANETKIENFIAATDTMNQSDINGLPTKARGLSAIEYLLFDTDLSTTVSSFSNQRRIDFLLALNANLVIKSSSLKNNGKIIVLHLSTIQLQTSTEVLI